MTSVPCLSSRYRKVARTHQFLVDELLDAHVAQFAPVAGVLDATEGQCSASGVSARQSSGVEQHLERALATHLQRVC
jgi:hypothetical protein